MGAFDEQVETELIDGLFPLSHSVEIEDFQNDDWLALLKDSRYESYIKIFAPIIFALDSLQKTESNLEDAFVNQVAEYIKMDSNEASRTSEVLGLGVASLQLFVQANWLGKEIPEIEALKVKSSSAVKDDLVLDGENLYPLVRHPILLLVARVCLFSCPDFLNRFKTVSWWALRYLNVHQKVLEEPSIQIHDAGQELITFLSNQSYTQKLQLQLFIEIAYFNLMYHEVQKAQSALVKAESIAQIDIVLTGALGKRTKFQDKNVAQLTVKCAGINIEGEGNDALASSAKVELPRDVTLEDDVRLNRIAFVDPTDQPVTRLMPLQQLIFLAIVARIEKSHPVDSLVREEILPFLSSVLSQPQVWAVQSSALLMRSKLESSHGRTVERAMMQVQEVLDATKRHTVNFEARLAYFYSTRLPTLWEIETQLADLLSSLGLVKEALDTYLRLQQWEKVISCYQQLQLKHRAEEIVRQELEKGETPKLWCLLGDCTDDEIFYEKAWELSKHRSARAQRDWGFLYYRKKKYEECILHFQKSLEVNPLQEGLWLRLAFSALELEQWELAANAYRKYCTLDSDNSDAWNNAAKCYIKLGQKNRAWKALMEAVKCNYDSWKIWDNLMVVSADCGEFEEMIRCYHRLIDLKEKHADAEILKILVEAINAGILDSEGRNAGRLRDAALKLFGRLTAIVPNNAQIWKWYAILTVQPGSEASAELYYKAAQYWQKAYRSSTQDVYWEKETCSRQEVLDVATNLAAACLESASKPTTNTEAVQLLGSSKLSLKSIVTKLKNYELNLICGSLPEDTLQSLSQLESLLEKLIVCQQELQGRQP